MLSKAQRIRQFVLEHSKSLNGQSLKEIHEELLNYLECSYDTFRITMSRWSIVANNFVLRKEGNRTYFELIHLKNNPIQKLEVYRQYAKDNGHILYPYFETFKWQIQRTLELLELYHDEHSEN